MCVCIYTCNVLRVGINCDKSWERASFFCFCFFKEFVVILLLFLMVFSQSVYNQIIRCVLKNETSCHSGKSGRGEIKSGRSREGGRDIRRREFPWDVVTHSHLLLCVSPHHRLSLLFIFHIPLFSWSLYSVRELNISLELQKQRKRKNRMIWEYIVGSQKQMIQKNLLEVTGKLRLETWIKIS